MKKIRKKNEKYLIDQFHELNLISHQMKKSLLFILKDFLTCKIKQKASLEDYLIFKMYQLNKYERKTIITRGVNNELVLKYNDPKYVHTFQNKVKLYQTFSKYINRTWIEIGTTSKNDFALYCLNHREIIVKPSVKKRNEKVEKITISEYKLKELYEEIVEKNQTLIEEIIIQNKELSKLHKESINSVEVITLLGKTVAAYLKIGNNKNKVDSFEEGGLIAPIDIETGIVSGYCVDKEQNIYEKHPLTKTMILGFKIPLWEEIKKTCEEMALEIPQIGYASWTIAVGEEKLFLLDAKDYPDHTLYSLENIEKNNIGLLKIFREVEERKYEE